MTARALPLALGVVVVGVFVGSGLAALAHVPPNDPCQDYGTLPEGSSSSGSLELWPLGLRCEYYVGSRLARSEFFGPSAVELYAWIVGAMLIAAIALLNRDSAFVRGTAAAATLLALIGAAWHYAGVQFTFFTTALIGLPVAFALDHLLRRGGTRSARASLQIAVVLAALVFFAPVVLIVVPLFGIAIVGLVGALASMRLARARGSLTT